MSDQKVEYEPVPESDLHEYQRFHLNKAKTEQVDPVTGGIAAEALGIPAIAGAKTLKGVLGSNITKEITNRIAEKIAPPAPPKPPIPTTVGEFHAPQMVTEHGFGPGAVKNALHNVDQAVANPVYANVAANPERGFELKGNSRILTPEGTYGAPPAPPPQGGAMPPMGGAMPAGAPPAPPPLTATQRAMQVVKGAANSPAVRAAGTVGGLWEGGENLVRLWNHFKEDNPARELLDVAGVVSNAAMLAPTPASPWSNIGGAAASIPIGMYQRHLEEQDKLQKKATGGLVYLR
jgi:hypothetical protein